MNISIKIAALIVIVFIMLLGLPLRGYAATWGDVLSDYNMYISQYPNDSIWIEKVSGCGARIWDTSRSDINYHREGNCNDGTWYYGNYFYKYACHDGYMHMYFPFSDYQQYVYEDGYGCGSGYGWIATTTWVVGLLTQAPSSMESPEFSYNDGISCANATWLVPGTCQQSWNIGQMFTDATCNSLDTLLSSYTITQANCMYNNIFANVFGSNLEYALNVPINKNCQACIPLGTQFDGSDQGYAMVDQNNEIDNPNNQVCYYSVIFRNRSIANRLTVSIPQNGYGADLSLSSNSTGTLLTQPTICDGDAKYSCLQILNGGLTNPQIWGLTNENIDTSFTPNFNLTLLEAAQYCGFVNFDWVQTITHQNDPSEFWARNTGGTFDPSVNGVVNLSSSRIPYNDPPPGGGYACGPSDPPSCNISPDYSYPFYYDVAGELVADYEIGGYTLTFHDAPSDGCLPGGDDAGKLACNYMTEPAGSYGGYTTHLAGVNADGTATDLGIGFTWTSNYNGTTGGVHTKKTNLPADGNGTGGITITSVRPYLPVITVANQVNFYSINDGTQFLRSSASMSTTTGNGTVSQTINPDGSVTLTIINSPGYSDDGFYFQAGTLGNFNGLNIATSTGSDPISMNIWFDVDNNGEFFAWNGNVLSGLGNDAYILGPSSVQNVLSVNANSNFTSLIPGGGNYTLAQLKSGAAPGITSATKIAIWVGFATNGSSLNATINSISIQ